MYPTRYIQYFELPPLPDNLIAQAKANINKYLLDPKRISRFNYTWSDYNNQDIDEWCKKHICTDMYFAVQIATDDLIIHKDTGTAIKLNFLIDPGGPNTTTEFYDDDKNFLASYKIEPFRWHIFQACKFHGVSNVSPGTIRLAVTGRVFEY